MNDDQPPLSAADESQSTSNRFGSDGLPSKSVTTALPGVMVTIWSLSSAAARGVNLTNALTSLPRKCSPSP